MKVVTHTPEPTPPPETYDFIGLTRKEAVALVGLAGRCTGQVFDEFYLSAPESLKDASAPLKGLPMIHLAGTLESQIT